MHRSTLTATGINEELFIDILSHTPLIPLCLSFANDTETKRRRRLMINYYYKSKGSQWVHSRRCMCGPVDIPYNTIKMLIPFTKGKVMICTAL